MSTGIIELNDAGIRVGSSDNWDQPLTESPGVAVIGKKDLLLGHAALEQARLNPLQSNSLFWHRLSTEPLSVHNSHYRHHADLAYSQLLELHKAIPDCDQVIFALPGSFSRQQMSLLLGIVGQCPFDAVGLVDSAVAASSTHVRAAQQLHVDLQLHQCVFTQIEVDGQVARSQVEVLPHCGLLTLRDYWAKAIADQFIDQSRFDPLHSADTEQSLYDQLPNWLQQVQQEGEVFLDIGGKHIKLSHEQMVAAVRPLYRQITDKAGQLSRPAHQVLLGDRLAALPGLLQAFEAADGSRIAALPASAVMEGIQRNLEHIKTGSEQLRFVQSLPAAQVNTEADTAAPREPAASKPAASHLLIGAVARPLGAASLQLDLRAQQLLSDATQAHCSLQRQGDAVALTPHVDGIVINRGRADERPAQDNCTLAAGDTISLNAEGPPLTLIKVVDGHGS